MASGITYTTRQFSAPYLTVDEYKQAPTAIDWTNIVVGGNLSAQEAELSNVITRASSWVDQFCNQILGATLDAEQQRTRVKGDGTLKIHPRYWPVVSLESFQFGTLNNLQTLPDCSVAWVDEQTIVVPYAGASLNWSSSGPLGFGFPYTEGRELYVKYTYVNGYANTLLAANVSAGGSTITVDSGLGIVAGQSLNIYEAENSEMVTVSTSYVYGSTTVPLASPLVYAHNAGVSVSALPAAVKEATILATTAFIKVRGDNALVMAVTDRPGQQVPGAQDVGDDLALAQQLLRPFRRIR